jgi:sulfur carrier protein
MELTVNGKTHHIDSDPPTTVADLLHSLDVTEARGVAVALNDEVVPRRLWTERALDSGDRVEIIRATQGG